MGSNDMDTKEEEQIASAVAEAVHGNLSKVHRIVARHALKDRIKILEGILRTHQPLIQAMRITKKAYQDGVMYGIRMC
jgi:hypothetical protein